MSDPLFPQAPTLPIQCPNCGLIKPASATQCDCGHPFHTGKSGSLHPVPTEVNQSAERPYRKPAWLMVNSKKPFNWFFPVHTVEDANAALKIAYQTALAIAGIIGFFLTITLLSRALGGNSFTGMSEWNLTFYGLIFMIFVGCLGVILE